MSYIRALTNPDGLYVWRGDGRANLLVPSLLGEPLTLPDHVLVDACHRWWHGRFSRGTVDHQVRHRGLVARQSFRPGQDRRYEVVLTFKDWGDAQLTLWLSTWEALVARVVQRHARWRSAR